MKKILTLLTLAFLTNGMLFGQCAEDGNSNGPASVFNLNYATAAEATAAFDAVTSITFPAGPGCSCGPTVTLTKTGSDPQIILVNTGSNFRIRGRGVGDDYFADITAPFDIVYNLVDGSTLTCSYDANGDFLVSALPVDLISFDAIKKDRQINLSWKTASEINNEGFVIERGHKITEGIEWNRLDFIRGNGTTQASQAYSFIDQRPAEGTNYYRLKQMDYDGAYEYSSIVAVEYSEKTGSTPVEMFPNPAKTQLTLVNGEGKATIYNTLGQPVKQLIIGATQATIPLTDLLNGQYYLQVVKEDGTIVTKQFAKVY